MSCAGCSLCCEIVPVAEIGLSSFTRCPMLLSPPARHVGCSIYETRPASCRKWKCLFLENPDWPDDLLPARCGVVFDEMPDVVQVGKVEMPCIQAWVRPGLPEGFWNKPPLVWVVASILDNDIAVLFRRGPKDAFVVCRGADKQIWSSEHLAIEPRSTEPDAIRFVRASKMMAARGLLAP